MFPAWISQVTRHLAADWQKQSQHASQLIPAVPLEDAFDQIPDTRDVGARQKAEAREQSQVLRDAILRLPPEQGEIVLLHYSEDLSTSEIARRLGIHPTTVRRRLKKAKAQMKSFLEPILREFAPTLQPSRKTTQRSIALIATTATLSAKAKASLIASAGGAAWLSTAAASTSGYATTASIIVRLLRVVWSVFTARGKFIVTGKGVAALALILALIGSGVYYYHHTRRTKATRSIPTALPLESAPRDRVRKTMRVGDKFSFREVAVQLLRVNANNIDDQDDDSIELLITIPPISTEIVIQESQTRRVGDYEITANNVNPSRSGLGQGRALIELAFIGSKAENK